MVAEFGASMTFLSDHPAHIQARVLAVKALSLYEEAQISWDYIGRFCGESHGYNGESLFSFLIPGSQDVYYIVINMSKEEKLSQKYLNKIRGKFESMETFFLASTEALNLPYAELYDISYHPIDGKIQRNHMGEVTDLATITFGIEGSVLVNIT